jgi:hypothetical protein
MAKSITDITGRTYDEAVYLEGEADGDITPGEILERTGTNSAGEPTFGAVSSEDKLGPAVLVATVPSTPPQQDTSDTDPVDQTIADGTLVEVRVVRPGETIQNALLANGTDISAGSANVSVGDPVTTAADGSVKSEAVAGAIFARFTEAVDNSTGQGSAPPGDRARIDIEVI